VNYEKILLIEPPMNILKSIEGKRVGLPIGIAYLGSYLREKGYDVFLLDAIVEGFEHETLLNRENNIVRFGLSFESISEKIKELKPDVVGVSSKFTPQWDNVKEILELTKGISQDIITVVGGAHPMAEPVKSLSCSCLDYVILGEGEDSLFNLMEYLNERYKIEDIDGIAYRRNGDVVVQQKQHFILDLDSLPYPARDLLHIEKYYKFPAHGDKITERYASLLSSRGCIANCIFCSVRNLWGKDFRMRSASNVLDEITLLTEKYEIKEIHFEDDNLTANKKRAYEIFNGIIERNLNIYWCLANGIALYTLNEDLLEVMKKSGCYSLGLAIESGSQEVLNKIIKKPLNLKKVKPLIKKIKELQIRTSAFFIIGFPGETKEQIYQTLNFASEIEVNYVVFYIATPFPGTQLYEIALRENVLISDNFDFSDLRWSKGNIITKEFTPEELEKIRVEYWQKINKIIHMKGGPIKENLPHDYD